MLMVALGGRAWVWGWWRSGNTLPGGFEPEAFQGEVWFRWVVGRTGHTLSPQLCCLHADLLGSLGSKEAKKAFLDFYHSFLEKTAVRCLPGAPALGPGQPPYTSQPPPCEGKPGLGRPCASLALAPLLPPLRPPFPGPVSCHPITAESSASLHSLS